MREFPDTVWSVISEAQRRDRRAREEFCARYRPAVVAYIERKGFRLEDAEDIGQQVFLRIFEKDLLEKADRSRGRFRSLVLGITKNLIREELARRSAAKRGGGARVRSLEATVGPEDTTRLEEMIAADYADEEFDRAWIRSLIERALERLKDESRGAHYHAVLRCAADGIDGHDAIAEQLGISPTEVRNALHRGRERLRDLVNDEIRSYSSSPREYQTEIRHLSRFAPRPLMDPDDSPPG